MLGNLNFNKNGRVIGCKVTIPRGLNNANVVLGPEEIMELNYEFSQDTENVIGATIGKQVIIKMRKDEDSSKIDWEKGNIKVELGIKTSNGMEYVNIGEFWRAYDIEQERYVTTVTLLEPMALDFEDVYKAAEGKDTITIGELMEHIQNKYGIFFKIGNTKFRR